MSGASSKKIDGKSTPPLETKSSQRRGFEPAWGAENWPRVEGELDEGDRLLIAQALERTPAQRLQDLESFVNAWSQVRRVRPIPTD